MYITFNEYVNTYGGCKIPAEGFKSACRRASKTIDHLTFCRIFEIGFDNLTEYQQGVIKEVCASLVDWQYENASLLDTPYTSYSINGVSATMGASPSVTNTEGEVIPSSLYKDLLSTGLCFRGC